VATVICGGEQLTLQVDYTYGANHLSTTTCVQALNQQVDQIKILNL
jgi:hypothetical protein